jgi:predicted RNase H-like HicB family nuclease
MNKYQNTRRDPMLPYVAPMLPEVIPMDKYEIILYWSQEDKVFIAEVPELPGCMAHGDTQEAALANAKEAVRLWLDTAREFGDPIPAPKGQRLMYA